MGIGMLRRYHGAPRADQPVAALPEAPKKGDNTEAWKAYALARGWDPTQPKAQIVEQYEADLAAQGNVGGERVVQAPAGASPGSERAGATKPADEAAK